MKVNSLIFFTGTKINTIYYNDSHGHTYNIDGFIDARHRLLNHTESDLDLTLCAGDVFIDTSRLNDTVAKKLMPVTDAIAAGNHDIEGGISYLSKLAKKFNFEDKFLAVNLFSKTSNAQNPISSSRVIEKNGVKVGIIGVAPLDFKKLAFISPENNDIEIEDFKNTISLIKKEVSKLEKSGVNIIYLLAHTGELSENGDNFYNIFSKIGGIDVIIGGHDHKEINRLETSSRGEPVMIVSTGKSNEHDFGENLDIFGFLNLEFDDNGVLVTKNSSNQFLKTPQGVKNQEDASKPIYSFEKPLEKSDPLRGHSEIANLIADSNLWYANTHTQGELADFSFVNPGTIRDNFDTKDITEEKIISALPFTVSKLIKTQLTKKQIIETLTHGAKSTSFGKVSPGIMQVSGLEYTIEPDLFVSNVHILNQDGTIKYDLNDFNDDDKFTCVYDIFLATGVAGLSSLKKEQNDASIEYFNISRQDALIDYLSNAEISDYTNTRIHIR